MKKILLLLAIIFSFLMLRAQLPGNWYQQPDFPGVERYAAQGLTINGKGYMVAGYNQSILTLAEVWEFDPGTITWTQKADFPGGKRWYTAGFTIGGKGYIGSGHMTHDWWEYEPITDTWTQKNDFPFSPRAHTVSFSIGNKGYVGMGSPYGTSVSLSDFWEYDPSTDTWIQLPDFPGGPRRNAIVFLSGTKAYIGAGNHPTYTYHTDLWEFEPANNSWQAKANFPGTARTSASCFSMNGFGYTGKGVTLVNNQFAHLHDWWRYNTVLDYWVQIADMPGQRLAHPVTFTFGSVAYVATGHTPGKHVWKIVDEKLNVDVQELNNNDQVNLYPNPSKGKIIITGLFPDDKIEILNTAGQIVFSTGSNEKEIELTVNSLKEGFYILKISSAERLIHKQFVIL